MHGLEIAVLLGRSRSFHRWLGSTGCVFECQAINIMNEIHPGVKIFIPCKIELNCVRFNAKLDCHAEGDFKHIPSTESICIYQTKNEVYPIWAI